jgi:hypothetical protein
MQRPDEDHPMPRPRPLWLTPLLLAGCGGEPPAHTAAPEPTPEDKARLLAARDALVESLGARLAEALAQGPEAGIAVCAEEAIPLTERIAAEHGVRMGRTSHRLRNPGNTAPAWAESLLAQRPEQEVFLTTPEGGVRALLPIRLQDRCVLCHGQPEQIPEPIRAALDAHYPDDEARGFSPGQIRGYVWVEG